MTHTHACQTCTVLEVVPYGQSKAPAPCFELRLEPPGWDEWQPGQFVMVRSERFGTELVWGRPFSISHCGPRGLSLFIQAVGRGTRLLSGLASGDPVTIWGPLGRGFTMEPETPTLMLAGGIGIAPFVGYVREHPRPEFLKLLFGHRLPAYSYPLDAFSLRCQADTMREKSPADLEQFIERIHEEVAAMAKKDGLVLACGPHPFLRTVQAAALEHGAACEISLENRMACGVGACMGCVSQDAAGHNVCVCTTGPVFAAQDVKL